MKKLNNKGMTLIEIIVCFAIVSVVVVSMFNVIMKYQNDEITESTRAEIIDYKNNITRIIQRDIINYSLKYVETPSTQPSISGNNRTYTYYLRFNNGISKTLQINMNDVEYNQNYIQYDDINNAGAKQFVKYILPSMDDNCSDQTCNISKFSSVESNITPGINSSASIDTAVTYTNLAINNFDIDININNIKVGNDYHVKIIAPLNYSYCKILN